MNQKWPFLHLGNVEQEETKRKHSKRNIQWEPIQPNEVLTSLPLLGSHYILWFASNSHSPDPCFSLLTVRVTCASISKRHFLLCSLLGRWQLLTKLIRQADFGWRLMRLPLILEEVISNQGAESFLSPDLLFLESEMSGGNFLTVIRWGHMWETGIY